MKAANQIIVHGAHITENLLHHKSSDVRRILEEKGFSENTAEQNGEASRFYPASGSGDDRKQTIIRFDDAGFVEEVGVTHSG